MKRSISMTVIVLALAAALGIVAGCSGSGSGSGASGSSQAAGSESSSSFSQVADTASSSGATSEAASGDSALAQQLTKDIEPIVKKSGIDVGVCIEDLSSGTKTSINGDKRMVAASMIKLAVAASFLEEVESGKYSLDDTYTLKDSDIVGGSGSIGGKGEGAEVTYGELLEKMISESDNTAANILIEAVGMKAVNATASKLGLKSTELNRLMMDEDAIAEGTENYTSANDVATILELAYKGELVSEKASKTLISALQKQQDETGLLKGLPSGTKFAHKTGSLSNAQHDGGIVSGNPDFILVTMCGGENYTMDKALEAMADIAKAAYKDVESK